MKIIIAILITFLCLGYAASQDEWTVIKTGINESLHDIEFINDSLGFIYSYGTGNIYRTKDEGYLWTIIHKTDSIYLEQIQFVDSQIGWICGEQGTVLKTTNSGTTWTDQSIVAGEDHNLLLYGMCFVNELTGFLSGAVLSTNHLDPKMYHTYDGGITWIEVFEEIPHMILNLHQKGDDIYATGNGFIIRIGITSRSWNYCYKDTSGIVGQIRDIKFVNNKVGMAVSFKGKVLLSTDGGNSFVPSAITSNRLRSIANISENRWIVSGDNNKNDGATVYITDNNGESWEMYHDFPDIHRVTLTERDVWIVGKNGFIAKMKR